MLFRREVLPLMISLINTYHMDLKDWSIIHSIKPLFYINIGKKFFTENFLLRKPQQIYAQSTAQLSHLERMDSWSLHLNAKWI
jgi:hypothetical protein